MDLVSTVVALGGACTRKELVRIRDRAEVDYALTAGLIVPNGRGRLVLPDVPAATKAAQAVSGVVSHRSAAAHYGWQQKWAPARPEVTVPRHRWPLREDAVGWVPHFADLPDDDVAGRVTSVQRTLVDVMRNLPFDEALAIVDSALRLDDIDRADLLALAQSTRGRGRRRILEVAELASGAATNPFESVLRAIALQIGGLDPRPQHPVHVAGRTLHPDVVLVEHRIALEAEGFEWHGDTAALTRDCRRYNALSIAGWLVVRFSWWLVMREPEYVRRIIQAAVAGRQSVAA